jgi:hypothetical protein
MRCVGMPSRLSLGSRIHRPRFEVIRLGERDRDASCLKARLEGFSEPALV